MVGRGGGFQFFARPVWRERTISLAVLASVWIAVPALPATAPELPVREFSIQALSAQAAAVEAAAAEAATLTAPPLPPPPPPVVWPSRGGLTGWFGERRSSHRHPGIDIDGNTGDPVVAAAAGTVTVAGGAPSGYSGYGTMVMITHADGLSTIYAHLSKVMVKTGQVVQPGHRVGSVGTSGNVTGSHLHFELRRAGAAIDPKKWLPRP